MTEFLPDMPPATVVDPALSGEIELNVALASVGETQQSLSLEYKYEQRDFAAEMHAVRALSDFSLDSIFPPSQRDDEYGTRHTSLTREQVIHAITAQARRRVAKPVGRTTQFAFDNVLIGRLNATSEENSPKSDI